MKDEICAVRYMARKREVRNACKTLAEILKGRSHFEYLCVDGRIILKVTLEK